MTFRIETERLYLRESTIEDAELAYALNLDPDVVKYTGDPPFISVEEARIFLANYDAYEKYGMGRWYMFLKDTDEFVGWCGLKYSPKLNEVDLGYRLLKKHWNKGYASESAKACLEYGFVTLGLEEIVARADKANPASIKVMQKIGMIYKGETNFDGEEGVIYYCKK